MNLQDLDAEYLIENDIDAALFKVIPGQHYTFNSYSGNVYSFDVEYVDSATLAYSLEKEWNLVKVDQSAGWTAYKVDRLNETG